MMQVLKNGLTRMGALMLALVLFVSMPVQASAANATKVEVNCNGKVVDSFYQVQAKYIPGTGNSNTGTYSCAQYVKNFYSQKFGVEVHNLLANQTPLSSTAGCSFRQISSGILPGDIGYQSNSRGGGHWFIIKTVSGNSMTIIEQNWKWAEGSKTYAYANRTVTFGSTAGLKVFRLCRNGQPANNLSGGGSSSQPAASTPGRDTAAVEKLLFQADYYASVYADLRQAFGNDSGKLYQHWKTYGIKEGRTASPLFDARWYLAHNPDVAKAYGAQNYEMAYNHFVHHGLWEGRQGSQYFSPKVYLGLYPDLKQAFGSNYLAAAEHFLSNGLREFRQASAEFSIRVYSDRNPDVAQCFSDNLKRVAHFTAYCQYGAERRPCV